MMSRILGGNRNRRRSRQPPEGRSRARSIIPVFLLGTCMAAALFGNVSFYTEKLSSRRSSEVPAASGSLAARQDDDPTAYFGADGVVQHVDTKAEGGAPVLELPTEEALPEPKTTQGGVEEVHVKAWPAEVGGGGVEEHWDDDNVVKDRPQSLDGWENADAEKEGDGEEGDQAAGGETNGGMRGDEVGRGNGPAVDREGKDGTTSAAPREDRGEEKADGKVEVLEEVPTAGITPPAGDGDQVKTKESEEGMEDGGDGSGPAVGQGMAGSEPGGDGDGNPSSASGEGGGGGSVQGAAASSTPQTTSAEQGEGGEGGGSGMAAGSLAVEVDGNGAEGGEAGVQDDVIPAAQQEGGRDAESALGTGDAGEEHSSGGGENGENGAEGGESDAAIGAAASSTPPTSTSEAEGKEDEGKDGGPGVAAAGSSADSENGNGAESGTGGEASGAGGAAASSTPPTGASEEQGYAEGGNVVVTEEGPEKDVTLTVAGGEKVGGESSEVSGNPAEANAPAIVDSAGGEIKNPEGKHAAFTSQQEPGAAVGVAGEAPETAGSPASGPAGGGGEEEDGSPRLKGIADALKIKAATSEEDGGGPDDGQGGEEGSVAVGGVSVEGGEPHLDVDEGEMEEAGKPAVEGELHEEGEGEDSAGGEAGAAEGEEAEGSTGGSDKGVGVATSGAVQGSMECATTTEGEGANNIMNIATWKDVPGDMEYLSPLRTALAESNVTKYITLEKDLGGFNNIRMSLECAVALAAATGRTFVIPPAFPIWNMNTNTGKKEVDLRELFSFDKLRESGRVSVMTTEEFLEKEAFSGNLGIQPSEDVMRLKALAVSAYLEQVGAQYEKGLPAIELENFAFVMPRRVGERVDLESESYQFAKEWLYSRELLEYREGWEDAKVIHWRSHDARLLAPFYAFVMHADEVADRYYKRLMRDLMHYPEEVYCKASQVIALLRKEDPSGSFSSFHIRRNDFLRAYQTVNIDPSAVVATSLDHVNDNEVIYIATDEDRQELFDDFKPRFRIRFLSDYYERAGVSELNPNLIGMLEQIIASHGRTFTGCWFSTFTAYILRLRGHLQLPRKSNFSYYPPRKTYHHEYHLPQNPLWATEWPLGWEDLDITGVPDAKAP